MNPTPLPEFERLECCRHLTTALVRRNLDSFRRCRDAFEDACERCDDASARAAIREACACVRETQRLIRHHQAIQDALHNAYHEAEDDTRTQGAEDNYAVPLFLPNPAKPYVLPTGHATPSLERVAVEGQRLLAQINTANTAELRLVARNLRRLSHHANAWARRIDDGIDDGCHLPVDRQAWADAVTDKDAHDDEAAPPVA
jgi:hypothetical protein